MYNAIRTLRAQAATLSVIALFAGLGVSVSAAPAHAAKSDCPAGALCAYSRADFAGTPGKVYQNNTDLTAYYSFQNVKSIYNHGNSCDVTIYTGTGYSGSQMTIERGDAYTFGSGSTFVKNGIGSNKWVNCS